MSVADLTALVAALPEVYQPIFGHPELSGQVSRVCDNRLDHILRICEAVEQAVNRPLRVLDLGCAQGYFSLSLAARGAVVRGVDFLEENIAVCTALAEEHGCKSATFSIDLTNMTLSWG